MFYIPWNRMWETFISWYLNNYLGHVVEDLNSQQLSLALSKGQLELENVPLKKNIFRSWGLPVDVKSGVVGRIKIEFNLLKYFRNEPVLISIEDVCLVAGPIKLEELNRTEEDGLARDSKLNALDAHEARWRAQFDLQRLSNSSSYYSSLYVSSVRIGASIVTKAVENLQLNVNNVHIRFEYESDKSNRVVVIGVTLQSLNVQSCDPKWKPLSSSSVNLSNSSFKTLRMNKMGVYCDTRAERMSHLKLEELKVAMTKPLPSSVYLLLPVTAEARVTKNNSTSPLSSSSKPRFNVELTLEKVPLQLADSQYKHIFRLFKTLRKLDRNCHLRRYRPFVPVLGKAKDWWHYASESILSLRGYRRRRKLKTWEEVLSRARDNCLYVDAYTRHLIEEDLSADAKQLRERMEAELHYDDILALRQVVMRRIEEKKSQAASAPIPVPTTLTPTDSENLASKGIGSNSNSSEELSPKQSNSGVLSWFFPSWSNSEQAAAPLSPRSSDSDFTDVDNKSADNSILNSESNFDEAILGEMRAFGKDALLARFNFTLSKGSVLLSKRNSGSFLELHFGGVGVDVSLKPRTGSHKFNLRLSSLTLKDAVTKSCILSPHSVTNAPSCPPVESLFSLSYEMKPHKKAGHRITISTKPMSLVIYPSTWDDVGKFFSVKMEEDYLEMPYNGYEAMKQKTREELRIYWERLIHSRNTSDNSGERSGGWDINMDIFAPQITIYGYATKHRHRKDPHHHQSKPFHLQHHDTQRPQSLAPASRGHETFAEQAAVIIDLGRFKFTNLDYCEDKLQSPVASSDEVDVNSVVDNEEDEEFLTPCSSPVPEVSESSLSSPRRHSVPDIHDNFPTKVSESFGDSIDEIHAKFYKKYSLEITDVQVVVIDERSWKDTSWKTANTRGTSMLHLIDRFSINLQMERRLIYSEDPLWPALTLVGTLPKLMVHVNESKVITVKSVFSAYGSKQMEVRTDPFEMSFQEGSQMSIIGLDKTKSSESFKNANSFKSTGKLFVAEFTINNVSIDLQTKGRNIAELQIVGTKTVLTHREDDTEFQFVIQSLLLADAVQTFGPDFQLLVASHKHVCMDSVSGSLKDSSEPTSPTSPVSPPSPLPPMLRPCKASLEIPSQLHDALLTSLHKNNSKKLLGSGIGADPLLNSNALIAIDIVLTKKEEDLAIINVQFNNLDIIANQETWIEFIDFFHDVAPVHSHLAPTDSGQPKVSVSDTDVTSNVVSTPGPKIQANFEFHRLNVLLLRGVIGKDGHYLARKIATVTASNAKVNCTLFESVFQAEGSLGGLQVLNLTPEGYYHQRVLSVGQDPLVEAAYNPFVADMPVFPTSQNPSEPAFTFRYEKLECDNGPTVKLRVASVIYCHSSSFLLDLHKCINQFQAALAMSLKTAATHIALGLVRSDTSTNTNSRSPFGSLTSLDRFDIQEAMHQHREPPVVEGNRYHIKLDVILNSPIIVLPRHKNSPEVLVAHLGEITMSEYSKALPEISKQDVFENASKNGRREDGLRYSVFIRDASLYTLNLKKRWKMMENFKLTNPQANASPLMRAEDLYRCDSVSASAILHNTVVRFNLSYSDEQICGTNDNKKGDQWFSTAESHLQIQGRVVSSLRVSFTPQQYSQLIDSITNIASVGETDLVEVNWKIEETRLNWKREVKETYMLGRYSAPPLPSPSKSEESFLLISSSIEVPDFIVEMNLPPNDLFHTKTSNSPVLSLSCSDLTFNCNRKNYVTKMKIALKALKLEDLSVECDSWRRVLAISKMTEETRTFLGTSGHAKHTVSCPNLATSISVQKSTVSSSLPENLNPLNIGRDKDLPFIHSSVSHSPMESVSMKYQSGDFCPVTPPPSPRPDNTSSDNLVLILVTLADPKSPKFMSEYGGNHKSIDIDFNKVDVVLIPETFVCLRQFFAEAEVNSHEQSPQDSSNRLRKNATNSDKDNSTAPMSKTEEDIRNTETCIQVKALTLKLANTDGHLAEAVVSSVSCELKNRGETYFGVLGRLGSLEIWDTSPYAGVYPLKFKFLGDQALDFDYTRNGSDGKFRLTMSSIVIVHTHRFYTEFMALWNCLFGPLSPSDSVTHTSKTKIVLDVDGSRTNVDQNTRIILDIQAGAPVILLPCGSTSKSLLIADLGHLSVRNKFIPEGEGVLINSIVIDLIEMDLYRGELTQLNEKMKQKSTLKQTLNLQNGWIVVQSRNDPSFLQQQCQLNLKVARVSEGTLSMESVAATRVQGVLSTVKCIIDPEKYKLVRGLLAHNIGEDINVPQLGKTDSKPQLVSKSSTTVTGSVDLTIQLDLVNVTLEVIKYNGTKLGRVDFIKSKFTFQSNTDGSKDVDLASQEILICDSRYEDSNPNDIAANIFTRILQQSVAPPVVVASSSKSTFRSNVPLQAEVHYRITNKGSNVTIVLNNMRLMVILDWWMEVKDFLGQEIPQPNRPSAVGATVKNVSPVLERSRGSTSAVVVSSGIVSKRAPVLDVPDSVFELKINISNCELVAVENASVWDTNALILKASAALGYRPHLERPISCNIVKCELFSCVLGLESDTALSILDPTNLQFDVIRQADSESQGILDATMSLSNRGKILKVQSPSLNLRLSYYDMKMFLRLMEKFSKEAKTHFSQAHHSSSDISSPVLWTIEDTDLDKLNLPEYAIKQLDQFVLMGFSRREAAQALQETHGCVEDALDYLKKTSEGTGMAGFPRLDTVKSESSQAGSSSSPEEPPALSGIEIKCTCLSLCVIDDCKDSDVPVAEITIQQLELSQNCLENSTTADCEVRGDYNNRVLSGWEPFLEPWKCNIRWNKNLLGQLDDCSPTSEFPSRAPEFDILISSREVMEINVTSSLMQLYKTVSLSWAEDYNEIKADKRRNPFVPFALKNETGSRLWFCTIISNNEEIFRQTKKGARTQNADTTGWIEVGNGGLQNFSFEGRAKLRHRNIHQLKTHQLVVRVDGWNEIVPVSVDRVGTYFRIAYPESSLRHYANFMELPPTRIVLEVNLHGSAQKVVTVRSALMIKNSLPDAVELKLENTIVYPSFERAQTGGSMVVKVQPGQIYPVPIHSIWAHMWIRPVIPDVYPLDYHYCTKALLMGNSQEGLRNCVSRFPERIQPYRFGVAVKRNEFPADSDEMLPQNSLPNILQAVCMSNRANFITLLSPFKLVNLLPHEILYEIQGQNISGRILPGKCATMTNVETKEPLEIHYQVDNFPQGLSVTINPNSTSLIQRIKLQDTLKRALVLTVKLVKEDGGVLAVHLTCPLWIVNKSGLPLLCKQEGTSGEAAGQYQEHEVGRMVTPLMMCFADHDVAEAITLRVGTGLHKDSKPFWCRSFLCQNGLRVRKLTVSHMNNTPESVYMVGVEVKNGTGRYRDTKLVIVYPRFVIDNRSSFKIQISQKAYATSFFDAKADKTHLTLPSGCSLPFHWPRLDKEQLLCVRFKDSVECSWSGGFSIDNVDSFHINVRGAGGKCFFLRLEIIIQGPSNFVILNDTTQLPPPFRIDNLTFVPLTFNQTCVGEERLLLTAKPESSEPYVLDEPTQLPHLTIASPGGVSVIANMDDVRFFAQLTYENFFYITFTATNPADSAHHVINKSGIEGLELVLDVDGTKVVLNKKEHGRRSQLWRVNADGLIEHEGSSPPRSPNNPSYTEGTMLVLDIAGPAPVPTQFVPLMLRKPDKRRLATQHWEFTMDGRMKCKLYDNVYVQAKDGFGSSSSTGSSTALEREVATWKLWSDVVLGPSQPVCLARTDSGIPAEQAISRQKLRPGSGVLNVTVATDGPTRVLRVIDVENPPRHFLRHHTFEENDYNTTPKYRVTVDLPAGIGVDVISCIPREELLYGRFTGLSLELTDTKNSQILKASVTQLQIDNQLFDAEKSAVIYNPSSSRSETYEDLSTYQPQPALFLHWESMKSNLNARVYKTWELVAKPINLVVDEKLLLKLSRWLGFGQQVQTLDMLQQADFEMQKILTSTASGNTRRYYFAILKLVLSQVKLSVLTASKLQPELAALKRRLGLTLIRFEEANIDLDPFQKHHPFETSEFLWALVVKHYRDELVSQAAVILGSTDFLGNPLGFVNDVSEGVSLMIYEGSVGALVKNVAHGLSNSAAKVTGTLGEGLGKTILDDKHEEERRRIKDEHTGSSSEYFYAGLKGLGHGIIGGATSVVTQSYEGASNDGFSGFFAGFTKGIVGTITKPAVGVLDLATGTASAIRDSSKTSSRMMPHRLRPTRVVVGNGGLLPLYSESAAWGQEVLFDLNDRNYNELFIACETLKSGLNQELRMMISSQAITVFRPGKGNPVLLKVPLSELVECQIATHVSKLEKTPYIELVRHVSPETLGARRPQVICESEAIAKRVVQHVNYAKVLFEEMRHSSLSSDSSDD